jgi:hypothetical protein
MKQVICDVDVRVSQNVRERMMSSRPTSWPWDEVPLGWDEGMTQLAGHRVGSKEDHESEPVGTHN